MRRRRQSGQSLISVIGLTSIAALLVIATLSYALSGTNQSTRAARADVALQAAEAGIQLYISRMVEDPRYYRRFVDTAEDPRVNLTGGGVVAPGSAWPTGNTWTYSGPVQNWRPLQDARFGQAAYNLRVQPVPGDPNAVLVQSTARVMPSGGNNPVVKSVQARIQPISIADFQMIADQNIIYGSSATTTGKLYSSGDVMHLGTAMAPVYAQRFACRHYSGSGCGYSQATSSGFQGGAFDSASTPSFTDKFPTPIDFTSFTQDLVDIKAAAQATGVYRDDPTANGWMVQFLASGQVRIWKITGSSNLGVTVNQLQCPTTVSMPGGATPFYIYFEQPAVIGNGNSITDACGATSGQRASVVDGQVTLASKANVYIGNNISYETDGDDVLGLVAGGEMIMAENTPYNLSWRAATLAQSGQWRTNTGSTFKGNLVFTGSTATKNGGYASMFSNRTYNYDTTLQSLRPPLFPTIEGSWGIAYWREVTPPA